MSLHLANTLLGTTLPDGFCNLQRRLESQAFTGATVVTIGACLPQWFVGTSVFPSLCRAP